jgi:predicted nucleic acid-binding Zn ribbon protein
MTAAMHHMRDVIADVMQRFRLSDELLLDRLRQQWPTLVGDIVAQHAVPAEVRKKTLIVAVKDATWRTELQATISATLLTQIQRSVSSQITTIRWVTKWQA